MSLRLPAFNQSRGVAYQWCHPFKPLIVSLIVGPLLCGDVNRRRLMGVRESLISF
jgi:hypothetical protein